MPALQNCGHTNDISGRAGKFSFSRVVQALAVGFRGWGRRSEAQVLEFFFKAVQSAIYFKLKVEFQVNDQKFFNFYKSTKNRVGNKKI